MWCSEAGLTVQSQERAPVLAGPVQGLYHFREWQVTKTELESKVKKIFFYNVDSGRKNKTKQKTPLASRPTTRM